MLNNREAFTKLLLQKEGGVANHPLDPGGLTNLGITKETLEDWRKRPVTDDEVKNLTMEEATEIIWLRYWNPIRANDLVGGIDIYLADFSFNSGIRNAVKTLQGVLGFAAKDKDGIVGPMTLQAVAAQDPAWLLRALHRDRMSFLRSLKTWPAFGRGWTNRCNEMLDFAFGLLPAQAPVVVARNDKIKRNVATIAATVGTAVPVIVSSLPAAKEAYSQMQDTLSPFVDVAPWLPAAAGAAVMLGVIWLSVRNATMAHNAKVTGAQAAIVAEPRIPQEAAT